MNRKLLFLLVVVGVLLNQCKVLQEVSRDETPVVAGLEGLSKQCIDVDTIQSILIKKAEALLMFDNERYEVSVSLYSKKDSIIYISAVNSGYEILRATVDQDSIKVINRLNRIVYRSPLQRKFGYQYPVNFRDLQNLISTYYLCDDMGKANDDRLNHVTFEFDENYVKKRIIYDRNTLKMSKFEFFHQKTDRYIMGESLNHVLKIYSNFMITEFEIQAEGGTLVYNQDVEIKMDVNPRKYTFTELR